MAEQFVYQVARIRSLELQLFSDQTVEQLIAVQTYDDAIRFLQEKGWGTGQENDADAILDRENEKIWALVKELNIEGKYFDVLSLPKQYHNLKAAVKESIVGEVDFPLYYEDTEPSGSKIKELVRDKEYDKLPEGMRKAAREAVESLLHTGDGQLCDIIIDRACLEAVEKAGKKAGSSVIRVYAESTVAVADIKTAVRAQKTGKSVDFIKRALAECETLDIQRLAKAAFAGAEELRSYLSETVYSDGANALAQSPSAFERWCDNRIIRTIKPQKYESFTIGPVVAYVIARLNEIKTVRIILSGKLNGLTDESIRERVREMYV